MVTCHIRINTMTQYEENVSGFKITGSWCDIVKHGEQIAFALEELGIESDYLAEYNEWRPKTSENMQNDINEKTAEKAVINKTEREKENNLQNDVKKAGEEFVYSYKNLGEPEEVFKDWISSLNHAARAMNVVTRKSIREFEKTIYKNVMTVVSPYYFDNELVSANLNRINKNPQKYTFEVNINDDNIKSKVSTKLNDYQSEYDRWHVSADKNTDSVNFAEGAEDIQEQDNELDPKPTQT